MIPTRTRHGFTMRQSFFGGGFITWTASGCRTRTDAIACTYAEAIDDEWTPPRWWQWWRWRDTRLDPDIVCQMAQPYVEKYRHDDTVQLTIHKHTKGK